jgi:hypothetical protein
MKRFIIIGSSGLGLSAVLYGLLSAFPRRGKAHDLTRLGCWLAEPVGEYWCQENEVMSPTDLTSLEWLELEESQLSSLPPEIGQLINLKALHLEWNELSGLPPEIGHLTNLKELTLGENPLEDPPPDVVEQGTAAVLAYLCGQLDDAGSE